MDDCEVKFKAVVIMSFIKHKIQVFDVPWLNGP